ncbi:MAG: FAD-dependent oxidoreductase [Anaerolineales bacterium]
MSDAVLVIGGGIAGIQASLDLAQAGARVLLVEKEATIGGKMAVLDKNFPTLDCSICIEAPKMSEVELHPNIEIMNLAEVTGLTGQPGAFKATIRQRAGYVTDECTRCDDCVAACPVVRPNEYDSGLASRKAIYTPIPQAVPGAYVIDIESCLNQPPNYLPCNHCTDACAPQAIDFLMEPERVVIREVGSVVVAVGFDSYDPHHLSQYGYGTHPDILTALEYERLINSAGPTGGEILRPSDGRHPEKILFVLCVGSRDQRYLSYCSRFCCMYSIKHAYQAIDHGLDDVTVLYMDVRAYGKGFDGFCERTGEAGARFIRGRPAEIRSNGDGRIHVSYEDTAKAVPVQEVYDMVVLANAATPPDGLEELASALDLRIDQDGFLHAQEDKAGLVMSSRAGVYLAGCSSGPKDIPDSVSEGSGAAALALSHLTSRFKPEPLHVKPMEGVETPRVGVFVCHCGSNIAGVVDVVRVTEFARGLPEVTYAAHQMFSCTGSMQAEIEEAIKREKLTRVVIAACSPKTHEGIFRGVMERSGLNPYLLEMANIRNMDSWVHKFDKEAATTKAMDMVSMAVEKARRLEPLEPAELNVTQRSLVVGGGIAGMTAAIAIANQGIETSLVERSHRLGGQLLGLHSVAPAGSDPAEVIDAKIAELDQAGVTVHLKTEVEKIDGVVGNFKVQLTDGSSLTAGALVLATGAGVYQPTEFGFGEDPAIITNLELEGMLADGDLQADRVTFISCIGSRNGSAGCSRYCCTSMIHQALELRRRGKAVRVLSKDIRTYSRLAEELYEQAMREGVQFFRYPAGQQPEAAIEINDGHVVLEDELLGQRVRIPTDLTVLVSGLTPDENLLADELKLARSEDGFLMELHPKLGPAETASQGI